MLVTSLIQEQLIQENIIVDKILEKKDQFLKLWKKRKEDYPKKLRKIEKKLIDAGFDVEKIKKDAKSAASKNNLKNGKSSNFCQSVNKFINDFAQKKYLTTVKEKIDEQPLPVKIIVSLGLLAVTIYMSIFLQQLIFLITRNATVANAIYSVLIAPIVEETGKMISVKHDLTGPYFILFNIYEFLSYVIPGIMAGVDPIAMIIIRIPSILVHLVNTVIHVESKKKNDVESGMKITIAIHMIWNALGSLPRLV